MAGRSWASPDTSAALPPTAADRAACSSASRCTGTPAGEVIVAAAPGTKLNPVITPPVVTVTSAVACCHHGFLTERTGTTSPLRPLQSSLRRAVWFPLTDCPAVTCFLVHPVLSRLPASLCCAAGFLVVAAAAR